jgi:hypothetical protein
VTHEERATWIRRGFVVFVLVVVALAAWFFPKKQAPPKTQAAVAPTHLIEILHFHLPNDPQSEQIADHLNVVESKYTGQVLVTRLDVNQHPERAKEEKVTRPPKVVMMAGTIRACKFQGLWTQAQIERKVDEILRGLKRHGKDWRPDVQGMLPAGTNTSAQP